MKSESINKTQNIEKEAPDTVSKRATEPTSGAIRQPVGLLTNEAERPLNIEGAPMFDWWLLGDGYDEIQTAYQIRLYDGIMGALVWDSGRVESSDQNCVLYTGEALRSGYPYSWEVRVWDANGNITPYSERAEFATGLKNEDWGASWILGVKENTAIPDASRSDAGFGDGDEAWLASGALIEDNSYWYSRKEIELGDAEIKRALAYVAGSQDYELSVNGVRIGRAETYDYLGETKYQGWDITDAIKQGNTAAIGILTAYFDGGQGRAVSRPGLIAKFIVYYADGTVSSFVTDGSWLTHKTAYSNLGPRNSEGDEIECCDARLMPEGWAEVGYDTAGWVPVIVHGKHPTKTFYNLEAEIGKVVETRVSCVGVTRLPDGTTVADFGKVIPATVIIHFPSGTAGTELTIQEGYELRDDGTINTSKETNQHTNMTYVYVMKDGEQTFEAWGFLGFRYVSVPPEAGVLTKECFEATVLHAEVVSGRASTLDTSDTMINQVFELFKRSALYSVQNQFVDTPTREKGQFLVDAVNSSAATTTGSFERLATRKAILQFCASSDRHWSGESERGMYNAVYPNVEGCRGIPDFSLNLPHLVWRYYMLTGDRVLLEYVYPYMKYTADFVTRNTSPETGLVTALPGGGEHHSYSEGIVDSPAGRFGYDWKGTLGGARTTVNALGVRVYDIVIKIANELGFPEDAKAYSERRDTLIRKMNERLLTECGAYCDGLTRDGEPSLNMSQHASSHAIVAGVATGDALRTAADYIATLGMKQGPMTADTLIDALFRSGRADAAVGILTNTEDYGWAKLIKEGYTYTWENWQAGSQSHGWGSASLWQLIEYISGVKIIKPGAGVIRIAPAHGVLDSVTSHTATARGAVDISYRGSGESYEITVDVPVNMTAEILFPRVPCGEFCEIYGRNGQSRLTEEGQIITVGSGKRSFKFLRKS